MLQPSIVASEAQQGWVTAIAEKPPFLRAIKTDPSRIVTSPEALLPEALLLIEILNLHHRKNLNTNVIILVCVKQVVLNLLPVR